MFDIGFSELLVIAVVALIVIGPERLPKVARTLGHLFGRMQRYVNDVKADIAREMELEKVAEAANPVPALQESPAASAPAPTPEPAQENAAGMDAKQPDLALHGS